MVQLQKVGNLETSVIRVARDKVEIHSHFTYERMNVCVCLCMYECTYVQVAAEIVKHFKILVTCFSARVSRSAGILT